MDAKVKAFEGKNRHVDETVVPSMFIDSAKCMLYAASAAKAIDSSTVFIPVGMIQSYSFNESRDLMRIFELGSDLPYMIPGRTAGAININRVLIQGGDIVNAILGTGSKEGSEFIASIGEIAVPLHLMFVMQGNSTKGDAAIPTYSRAFSDCWITSRNEQISAGQSIVAEGVAIQYAKVDKVKITYA